MVFRHLSSEALAKGDAEEKENRHFGSEVVKFLKSLLWREEFAIDGDFAWRLLIARWLCCQDRDTMERIGRRQRCSLVNWVDVRKESSFGVP